MFHKMETDPYARVAPLFEPLSHNLSITAVLKGKSQGWVYVDHPTKPQSAFVGTMEGYFMAGDANNLSFNSGVCERIQQMVAGDTVRPDTKILEFEYSSPDWIDQLDTLFDYREPLTYLARHYQCDKLALHNWRDWIPQNLQVQSIGREQLQHAHLDLDEGWDHLFHPYEWAMGFGSIHNYLKHGFGYAVMAGDQMVSWCMSDCVAKNQAEIGIYTLPEYRRQGLGTIAAAAAVEYCLHSGMEAVGWHCNDGNIASQRTAEKVGFKRQKTRERHYLVRPEWRHFAELGLRDFHNGEFESCVKRYRTVFSLTHEAEDYIYHLAAMAAAQTGDLDHAIIWLRQAAQRGWKNLSYTESRGEVPETPAPGMTWRDLPKLNQSVYERHKDETLAEVLAQYEKSYQETLALIEAMTEREIFEPGVYEWTGGSSLLSWIAANTSSHYNWARRNIRTTVIRKAIP